jgi:mono/diheme cytochrome c family protein
MMDRFMLRFGRLIRAISVFAIVVVRSAEPAYADAALIARGYALAMNLCSRCHAIGKTGESTNPKSPPSATFRADIDCPTWRKRSLKASSLATKG